MAPCDMCACACRAALQERYDKYRVGTRLGAPAELLKRYGSH